MDILGEKHDQKRKVVRICVEALLGSTEKGTVVVTRNPRQHAHMTFSLRPERNGRHLKPNFMHTAKMAPPRGILPWLVQIAYCKPKGSGNGSSPLLQIGPPIPYPNWLDDATIRDVAGSMGDIVKQKNEQERSTLPLCNQTRACVRWGGHEAMQRTCTPMGLR
ncbi:hypothetical protein VNO77_27633 [Canavalia gladiata]|uniref:Uncharacterized protein n=1 Tax=Canavalia gladiata TaxID=3824 RepID=A0AAN9Q6N6_CANGL